MAIHIVLILVLSNIVTLMSDEIIQWLNILANICTILGFIIALISLIYFLRDYKNKIEYETRKAFIEKGGWTNEGDIYTQDSIFFSLEIENTDNYVFSGTITTSNYPEKLTFYFDRVSGKSIFIKIHKNIGWRDVDLALAKLKFISPDLIQITFTKGFEQDNYQPEFPYKTLIWPFAQCLIVE